MTETAKNPIRAREVSCSTTPLRFDAARCVGCNSCMNVCMADIMIPAAEKGTHPVVLYPGECWYCGCCVMACSHDAIRLEHPLMNRTKFTDVI